jgi:ribosomal protein L12E/L44/L45/RPP1/RPP2
MQYLAAYALAALSGKKEIGTDPAYSAEADITKILQATGQPINGDEVKKVVSTLKGKKLEDVSAHHNVAH